MDEAAYCPKPPDEFLQSVSLQNQKNNANNSFSLPGQVQRKDAIDEFFRMTFLSLKMTHKDMNAICELKSDQLYHKAKMEKIKFYQFHDWLMTEIYKYYLNSLYYCQEQMEENKETKETESDNEEQPGNSGFFSKIFSGFFTGVKKEEEVSPEKAVSTDTNSP